MIYGERIRLRATELDDLPRYVAWLNDPEVRQFLLLDWPLSLAQEQRWFEEMNKRPRYEQVLMIEAKDGDGWKPIGNTSFMDLNEVDRYAEIGIVIGEKAYWSQGYGREAMRLMVRYGFSTLNLNRIFLRVYETNPRGIRAYEHAGFQHEGRERQARFLEGRYCDILRMAVLRSEWQDSPQEAGRT